MNVSGGMVGIGGAAARTVEFCPAVRTFGTGVYIAEFERVAEFCVGDSLPDIAHFVLGIIDKLMAGIQITGRCYSEILRARAASGDALVDTGAMFQIEHIVIKSDRLSFPLPANHIFGENLILLKDHGEILRLQCRGTVGICNDRLHGQFRKPEIVCHVENILCKVRVEVSESSAHVIALSFTLFDKLFKIRDYPVITAAAGIVFAKAIIDLPAPIEAEDNVMAFFICPFNHFVCHADTVGRQCKTKVFIFLLFNRARIGDQILADLKVHKRLSAEKVNFQISAHTGVFHQKVQCALSYIKGHQSMLSMKIPLGGKAVITVEITCMGDQKTKRLAQEEKAESKRRKTLERELEWVRMAPKARQAKQKARLGAYEKMASADTKQKEDNLEIYIPNGPHLGNKVIKFTDVSKAYGDKVLFEHLSFELPPAGIVGVIGPNGAGKTTLFRLIMGLEKPDSGTIEIGDTVKISYVDQQHRSIDPDKTVYETIAGNSEWVHMGGRDVNARAWVSRFNFSGADQEKKCGVLSGGERNRLHLALTLKDEGNVLLLDEPTNDVDVNTIRALEDGLENFAGCAVVVSHDRWFLDRIATHILAYEGDGNVVFFEGNYEEYEENRKMRLGPDAAPKRFKYKKLME